MPRTLAVLLALASIAASAADPANLILRGGEIHTLDAKNPRARALVIEGGRIAYVGNEAGARKYEKPGTKVIDLAGHMVLPGFHDAHTHPMSGGMRLLRCRLGEAKDTKELYAAIQACALALKDAWLLGTGWTLAMFPPEGPTRAKLDELVPDRPAFLTTEDGFRAWANTAAFRAAGIDPVPDGPVQGDLANRIRGEVPKPSEAQYREALRRTTKMANAAGITSIFDASVSGAMLDAYRAADRAGELTVRVVAAQQVDPSKGPTQVDAFVARRDRVRSRLLQANAAKIFLDGEIGEHTAALLAPYSDKPDTRGELYVQPAALKALVRALDAKGFDVVMHVMGDRAVHAGLDAFEDAMRANPSRDRRHQLMHIGVADPADIPRFGRLGIGANFQPDWFRADDPAMAPTQAALGTERSRRIHPIASILAAGGRLTAGSDWPSTSMEPLRQMQVAVTRQPLDGSAAPVQPSERVDLAAIVSAFTKDSAWAAREDAIDGTLEVGKAADLVVLDRDIFTAHIADLHRVQVLVTLLDGQPVYRAPWFAWP
jgi:predicted amidohydrolase YtcJ